MIMTLMIYNLWDSDLVFCEFYVTDKFRNLIQRKEFGSDLSVLFLHENGDLRDQASRKKFQHSA